MNTVLYEDNHLLIINKKTGELSQGDKTGDVSVIDVYKKFLKNKYNKPGNVFLGLVHRIDRPVSGALILAKTSKALSRLVKMMRDREIVKEYIALVDGIPEDEGYLNHWLDKDSSNNKVKVYTKSGKGKEARLSYKMLKVINNTSVVYIRLETGRSHQIRAQFAFIGHPIIGDTKYGWKGNNDLGAIALHSYKVSLTHPVKKEPLVVLANQNINEQFKDIQLDELF